MDLYSSNLCCSRVNCICSYYLSPLNPAQGSHWTWEEPMTAWAWPWAGSSPSSTCWAAKPSWMFKPLLILITERIQAIWLTDSTELVAIIGQIKTVLYCQVLSVFNLCNGINIWPYPTILSLRTRFKFLPKEATSEANHKTKRVFPFSRGKWVNNSAAANTGH